MVIIDGTKIARFETTVKPDEVRCLAPVSLHNNANVSVVERTTNTSQFTTAVLVLLQFVDEKVQLTTLCAGPFPALLPPAAVRPWLVGWEEGSGCCLLRSASSSDPWRPVSSRRTVCRRSRPALYSCRRGAVSCPPASQSGEQLR